jgi:hypothetical protein
MPLPMLAADLMLCSWETIARRSWMMMSGSCSAAEYQRMMVEKATAARRSATIMLASRHQADPAAILRPWHSGAAANVKRLRRTRI